MENNLFFVQRTESIGEGVNGVTTTHLITFNFSSPYVIKVLKTYIFNIDTYKIEDGCYFDGGSHFFMGEWSDLEFSETQITATFNGDILQRYFIEKGDKGGLIIRSIYDYRTPIGFAALTKEKEWMDEYGLNYCLD